MLRKNSVSGPDNADPWYAAGLRFHCLQCGRCCSGTPGYVWVTEAEIDAIAAHRDLAPAEFTRRHVRQVRACHSLLEMDGGDCEFLERLIDGTTRCSIHPVRPIQCRTWPFWNSNVHSQVAWRLARTHCPGIDNAGQHPRKVIEEALAANDGLPL
jgi:hypothetical protein